MHKVNETIYRKEQNMTAIEMIRCVVEDTGFSYKELAEYSKVGSKQNLNRILSGQDMKVSTLVQLLETLGFQLVAQSTENEDEYLLDYEE